MADIVGILKGDVGWGCSANSEEELACAGGSCKCERQIKQAAVDEIERLRTAFTEMREDLIYLNKMCMTLMSLLPPETTPDDVRAAMAKQGSHVREEKRIITDV